MQRPLWILVLVTALFAFAIWQLLYLPAALAAGGSVVVALKLLALGVLGVATAIGYWTARAWAPAFLVALGVAFLVFRLYEGLVLGIRPWLYALLAGLVFLAATLLIAAWTRRQAAAS